MPEPALLSSGAVINGPGMPAARLGHLAPSSERPGQGRVHQQVLPCHCRCLEPCRCYRHGHIDRGSRVLIRHLEEPARALGSAMYVCCRRRLACISKPACIAEVRPAAAQHVVAAMGALHHEAASGALFPPLSICQVEQSQILHRSLMGRQALELLAAEALRSAFYSSAG